MSTGFDRFETLRSLIKVVCFSITFLHYDPTLHHGQWFERTPSENCVHPMPKRLQRGEQEKRQVELDSTKQKRQELRLQQSTNKPFCVVGGISQLSLVETSVSHIPNHGTFHCAEELNSKVHLEYTKYVRSHYDKISIGVSFDRPIIDSSLTVSLRSSREQGK